MELKTNKQHKQKVLAEYQLASEKRHIESRIVIHSLANQLLLGGSHKQDAKTVAFPCCCPLFRGSWIPGGAEIITDFYTACLPDMYIWHASEL